VTGTIALVGGGEWGDRCLFDAALLAASGGDEVVVLPTAAAYEHPDRVVERATRWFAPLGGRVRGLGVLARPDAMDKANATVVAATRFVYLSSGSPLHLRSVLKETPVWEAVVSVWEGGGVVAGSSAGAMVMADPMVDPRGGAFTVGLGLVENLSVLAPAAPDWEDTHRRTLDLLNQGVCLAAIPEQTALIRGADRTWREAGAGAVTVWRDGGPVGLEGLPG
jgi:cyanophycinase